jgi:hypothetical protein
MSTRGSIAASVTIRPNEEKHMTEKTCAACDCPLDENSFQVKIGGRTVEVCCDECAVKLREAFASADSAPNA